MEHCQVGWKVVAVDVLVDVAAVVVVDDIVGVVA